MIILIGGEKGGTGKTTISTNLAALRANHGSDVLLIDTDKQGSADAWASTRNEVKDVKRVSCIQKFGSSLPTEINNLSNKFDDIIIDAGGRDSVELRAAMTVADKLYIPVQASQFDIWTLGAMDTIVNQVKIINPRLIAQAMINRASTNPSVSEVREAQEIFKEIENISLCEIIIKDRIAYRKAARGGLCVEELSPSDEKASEEIGRLYREVFENEIEKSQTAA